MGPDAVTDPAFLVTRYGASISVSHSYLICHLQAYGGLRDLGRHLQTEENHYVLQ